MTLTPPSLSTPLCLPASVLPASLTSLPRTVRNQILDIKALYEQLTELKKAGCEGVMADIWWGIVEREGPMMYDWGVCSHPHNHHENHFPT